MRYTEARLTKFTQEVCLADLDKNVIDFGPNFDETEKEPLVLPMRVPNLLINGAEGIAVGMATSIPTHNLCEVVDAVKAYMKNDKITTKQLMKYIKGPDFRPEELWSIRMIFRQSMRADREDQAAWKSGSGRIKRRQEAACDHRDPIHDDRSRNRKVLKRCLQSCGIQEDDRYR